MKWNDSRRIVVPILVLAACIPIPWWGKLPTLKMLSMGLLITAMSMVVVSRGGSTATQPDASPQPAGPSDSKGLKKTAALVLLTGAMVAISFAILSRASTERWTHVWPVYLFAAAVGAFLWTLSGLITRMRK